MSGILEYEMEGDLVGSVIIRSHGERVDSR